MTTKATKTLFDVSSLCGKRISGVGVYIKNLYENLLKYDSVEIKGVWKFNYALKAKHLSHHITQKSHAFFPKVSNVLNSKYDVFHGPDFNVYCGKNFKTVLTLHDLAFLEKDLLDDEFSKYYKEKVDYIIKHKTPDRIITVSEFTKEKLLEHYPQLKNNVYTVYHGANHLSAKSSIKTPKKQLKNPFILFIGNIERRKNIINLVKAFKITNNKHSDLTLKIVGKDGFDAKRIHEYIRNSSVKDKIEVIQNVNGPQLINFYQNALALAYPSFYEGFGFPILEAMTLGCPVITSNRGAMKEVSGESAIHVNPDEPESISEGINSVIEHQNLRNQLIQSGLNHVKQFTWESCAKKTIETYQS